MSVLRLSQVSLAFASLFLSAGAFAGVLQDQTASELATPRTFSSAEMKTIQSTQFIFVDGMFGDHFRANFGPAVEVLTEEWKAENNVIFPRSLNSMPTNSEILYTEIKQLRKSSKKRHAILISHSKGGAEVMMMLLHHPDVVSEMGFSSFAMVSAPLGGTNIVEFLNTVCNGSQSEACSLLGQYFPSAEGFASPVVQPIFAAGLAAQTPAQKALLESKLFYVETQMQSFDTSSPLFAPHVWMEFAHPEDGPNDGAIPTGYEIMYENGFGPNAGPVFGTDLGIMMGDHNSLMNKAKTDDLLVYRKAFFKVLVDRVLLRRDML